MKMVFSNVAVKSNEMQKKENIVKSVVQHNIVPNTEVVQSMQWNMIGRLMYSRTCKSCQR